MAKIWGKILFSNCSLRTRSTCILLFVHTLEHPNSPLFVTRKKISQQTISMTLILFENEVNHENLEIAIKKWTKMAFLKNFYFQTALSERVRPVFYFLFAHWNTLTLPRFPIWKEFGTRSNSWCSFYLKMGKKDHPVKKAKKKTTGYGSERSWSTCFNHPPNLSVKSKRDE